MFVETNGSNMSGAQQDQAPAADSQNQNHNQDLDLDLDPDAAAQFEFKVFNMVLVALALCILTFTALYCIVLCYNRSRQSKRAHEYESAVTRGEPADPVAVRSVKRSSSFIINPLALFRKPEDESKIYYIYSNPLPIGLDEEEEEEKNAKKEQTTSVPLTIEEYAKDPNSGVILDPPIFYMQI